MDIAKLLDLTTRVIDGEGNQREGSVCFNGYGFIFRDIKHSNEPYVVTSQSSKVCALGAYFGITEKALQLDEIRTLDELVCYNERYDCLYGGL